MSVKEVRALVKYIGNKLLWTVVKIFAVTTIFFVVLDIATRVDWNPLQIIM